MGRGHRLVHGGDHRFVGLGPGHREEVRIFLANFLGLRAHATGDDDAAVLGHGLADGRERFGLGRIEEAAGVDDDDVSPVMSACELIAFRPQMREDALGIHQRLGAAEGDERDLGRGFRRGRNGDGYGHGRSSVAAEEKLDRP